MIRIFKIIVITLILILGAILLLGFLKGYFPKSSTGVNDIENQYREDQFLENADDIYQKQLKQYEGVVKVLGVSLYGEGTHRLEKDDKLIALLTSGKVNLPDFEGKEVKVRGFVRDTAKGSQKIMDVLYIELLTESGVTLFDDVGYEFSFSYPAEWKVKKEQDKVTFLEQKNESLLPTMIVYQFKNIQEPLSVWLKDRDQNLFYEETTVKVGGGTGIRRTVKNGDEKIIKTYIKSGYNMYELRLVAQDEVNRNQYFSIVDFFKTSVNKETTDVQSVISSEEKEKTSLEQKEESKEEKLPELEESSEKSSEETSLTALPPLSSESIEKVLQKGFSVFNGKIISFEYPKMWYFSFLDNGVYGITDLIGFEKGGNEVKKEFSRILIIPNDQAERCVYQLPVPTRLVCAKDAGLEKIVDQIAKSFIK